MTSKNPGRRSSVVRHWPLALALLLALALRLALWGQLPRPGMISDEAEYLAAANWLAQGRGFAWYQGWLWTRAPLYPLFLAVHLRLFGDDLAPIYATQTLLSLVNVALVYIVARQLARRPVAPANVEPEPVVPFVAALLAAVYLPFAAYPQLLLSETLYLTLLLGAFVALSAWVTGVRQGGPRTQRLFSLGLAGVLLGLATLTRGLTLGFLPLVALWLWWAGGASPMAANPPPRPRFFARQRLLPLSVCMLATALTVLPWSVYASRIYGGSVLLDTTGAFNLLLGARTAYDGTRSDAPARNFVLALLDPRLTQEQRRALLDDQRGTSGRVLQEGACLFKRNDPQLLAALAQPVTDITQAGRQRLMMAEGLCLIQARPGAFLRKSLGELVDFFKINYTGAERLSDGFALGWLPRWWTVALFLLDDTIYVLLVPLAIIGFAVAWRCERRSWRSATRAYAPLSNLIALWWLYNLATAPLLFAINRFRVPLLPFAFACAAGILSAELRRPLQAGAARATWFLRPSSILALALFVLVLSPYAYLYAAPAPWASYLGPYPSSLANTVIAWQSRPVYLREQELMAALGRGDAATARGLLTAGEVPTYTQAIAAPLLEGLEGRPDAGLKLLDEQAAVPLEAWQTAIVRGDLLRRKGDMAGARAAFTPTFVDNANPVAWSWDWLHPPPLPDRRIDFGGNLDLGYIRGFYLGEPDRAERTTWRWSGPEAQLRFPGVGQAAAQQLCLRADGRGWPTDLALPRMRLLQGDELLAELELRRSVEVYCVPLPPAAPGADLLITLRMPSFVPDAADLLAQQGVQVGQLRRLGVKLDWAELR